MARAHAAPPEAAAFRSELGLPVSGVVVMSGHQAEFWHAGIAAKWFAAAATVRALNAAGVPSGPPAGPPATFAWVVVDQDSNEPAIIRYPSAQGPRLSSSLWRLGPALGEMTDVPTGARPAIRAPEPPESSATPAVARGLAEIARVMHAHADAPTLARQLSAATADLLAGAGPAPTFVCATGIARTSAFAGLLDRIAADPRACTAAYNAAIARHPAAGLKPLAEHELPLWHVRPGEPRRRVFAKTLSSVPVEQLAPRALLMTGLLRWAACDLFVHGTGGGVYDGAAEAWFESWLGRALAPITVATATLLLDHPRAADAPTDRHDAERTLWRAHHARHDPALVGDDWSARRKRDLLEQMAEARRVGKDRRPIYDELHRLLSRVRAENRSRLDELSVAAAAARAALRERPVLNDRTWPFPLHDPRRLADLAEHIAQAVGAPAYHAAHGPAHA